MGLFDFFKRKSQKPIEKTLEERNREYMAMRQMEVDRLNATYDFTTVESINSIPVPCFEPNGITGATGRVEYYLRTQLFAKYWDSGQTDLALACLRKSQQLMYISDMIWKRKDFMRLVYYLREAGFEEEAQAELQKIDMFFADESSRLYASISKEISEALTSLNTEYVEVTDSGVCCALCAKYRKRIYTVTGRDKRFPKFPADFHLECGLMPYPFVMGVNEPSFKCRDIIKYSNRPFVDDRTPEEVARHEEWKARIQQMKEQELRSERNHADYYWLQKNLPDICPKSLAGYSRMKNSNSANFQKLCERAAALGKDISST